MGTGPCNLSLQAQISKPAGRGAGCTGTHRSAPKLYWAMKRLGAQVSTGAVDDIRRATDLAFRAVAEYGLSAAIGPVSLAAMAPGDDGALMLRDTGAPLGSGPGFGSPHYRPCFPALRGDSEDQICLQPTKMLLLMTSEAPFVCAQTEYGLAWCG